MRRARPFTLAAPLAAVLAAASLAAGSCAAFSSDGSGGWKNAAGRAGGYRLYTRKESVPLAGARGSQGPRLTFSVSLLDAEAAGGKKLLSRALYDGLDCAAYAAERFNAVKNKYDDTKPLWGAAAGQDGTFQWSYDERVDGRLFGEILVVERVREIYQGGAHGSVEKECLVLDTAAQKRLRLADLVPAASLGALRKLAEAELIAVYAGRTGNKPGAHLSLRSLGFFEDAVELPADNFFLSPQGLGFVWNPYQIAPYSYGVIEITLPAARLRPLLTPRGTALLAKGNAD